MCIISAALHCTMLYLYIYAYDVYFEAFSMLELINNACRFYPGQLHCMVHSHKLTSVMHMLALGNCIYNNNII